MYCSRAQARNLASKWENKAKRIGPPMDIQLRCMRVSSEESAKELGMMKGKTGVVRRPKMITRGRSIAEYG